MLIAWVWATSFTQESLGVNVFAEDAKFLQDGGVRALLGPPENHILPHKKFFPLIPPLTLSGPPPTAILKVT